MTTRPDPTAIPYDLSEVEASGIDLIGYHDLEDRGGFKLAIVRANDKWYLITGSLWQAGFSVLDVTDPSKPRLVKWIDGPANTFAFQVQAADGKLIWGWERRPGTWGEAGQEYGEGFRIYDIEDPENPVLLGSWSTGATPKERPREPGESTHHWEGPMHGTHRNYYTGGRYVHASATAPGFYGQIYRIVDIDDPANPVEVGRWWFPEQYEAGGAVQHRPNIFLHGPAWVEGDVAYLSYTQAGMVILDISDLSCPRLISRLDMGVALGSELGVHTVVPLKRRNLAVINSEAIEEHSFHREPMSYTMIADITDDAAPRVISTLPVPVPPKGSPFRSFSDKPGRFGPHNQHHWQHHPDLLDRDDRVYMSYFNAGLRVFDISNEYQPREIASFVPPDPKERIGVLPTELTTQFEDVLVDARGYIYTSDKNYGIHILRETHR